MLKWLSLLLCLITLPLAAEQHSATFLHFADITRLDNAARLATALEKARADDPDAVTVVSGDFLSPSLLSRLTKGGHMISLFDALGVDIVGLGNHEFDFGREVLDRRVAESSFIWLATNVRNADGTALDGLAETHIRQMNGIRVGFLGLITDRTPQLANTGESTFFEPPIDAARRAVVDLTRDGAELIVAITHQGWAEDEALAQAVPEIDIILGGHNHDAATRSGPAVIQKSGSEGKQLGIVRFSVVDGSITAGRQDTEGFDADPQIAALVDDLDSMVEGSLGTPVVTLEAELDSRARTVRSRESAFGNMIADVIRTRTGAEIGLMNGGGIRGDRVYPAGTVLTLADIIRELPFENRLVTLMLSGAELRAVIERSLARRNGYFGGSLSVSGMTIRYDLDRPPGQRIISAGIGGSPLSDDARYHVATLDFLASGGDGYDVMAEKPLLSQDHPLLSDAVADHLATRRTWLPAIDHRFQPVAD